MVKPRLENLTLSASQFVEGIEGVTSVDDWVGLRPVTPDGLPVVGPAPEVDGLWVANGHAMLGLTLGPVTGRLLAQWILDGAPSEDLSLLRPQRFS
jgi:D-amino-acid dehydrogenase